MAQPQPRPAFVWPFPSGLGRIIAFLILVAAFVLVITGKMDLAMGLMFGGLALAELIP